VKRGRYFALARVIQAEQRRAECSAGSPVSEDENREWPGSTKLSDPHAATEPHLVDFLQTDLARCFTFADLAKTELRMGDWESAQSILEKSGNRMLHDCAALANGLER
jgi:hypothetical protein